MKTKIIRVAQARKALSHLYIDGIFQCFLLEDKIRDKKIMKNCHSGRYFQTAFKHLGRNEQNVFP